MSSVHINACAAAWQDPRILLTRELLAFDLVFLEQICLHCDTCIIRTVLRHAKPSHQTCKSLYLGRISLSDKSCTAVEEAVLKVDGIATCEAGS